MLVWGDVGSKSRVYKVLFWGISTNVYIDNLERGSEN